MQGEQTEANNNPQPTPADDVVISNVKQRSCNQCGKLYPYNLVTSKFCSDKCRVAHSTSEKKKRGTENVESENNLPAVKKQTSSGLDLPDMPGTAKYIINHQEKEIKRWEDKYNEKRDEFKTLKKKYDDLKAEQIESAHKQTLQGIEEAKPTFIEKLLGQLPDAAKEKITDKLLGLFPDAQTPALEGTNGTLDGESQGWLNVMSQWFSSLPKESQHAFAALVGELTKVQADQVKDVIIRMTNILSNGSTIENPNKQSAAYSGI